MSIEEIKNSITQLLNIINNDQYAIQNLPDYGFDIKSISSLLNIVDTATEISSYKIVPIVDSVYFKGYKYIYNDGVTLYTQLNRAIKGVYDDNQKYQNNAIWIPTAKRVINKQHSGYYLMKDKRGVLLENYLPISSSYSVVNGLSLHLNPISNYLYLYKNGVRRSEIKVNINGEFIHTYIKYDEQGFAKTYIDNHFRSQNYDLSIARFNGPYFNGEQIAIDRRGTGKDIVTFKNGFVDGKFQRYADNHTSNLLFRLENFKIISENLYNFLKGQFNYVKIKSNLHGPFTADEYPSTKGLLFFDGEELDSMLKYINGPIMVEIINPLNNSVILSYYTRYINGVKHGEERIISNISNLFYILKDNSISILENKDTKETIYTNYYFQGQKMNKEQYDKNMSELKSILDATILQHQKIPLVTEIFKYLGY